jgi:hypothetical protein
MPQSDAFALKNSGLNAFLFAEVGTEQNGSPLTILSILARLGKDPWAQAAEWARMPQAKMIESLTQSITQMPLCPSALANAGATAGRLGLLLPRQGATTAQTTSLPVIGTKLPKWLPLAIFCAVLIVAVITGTLVATPPKQVPLAPMQDPPSASIGQ